MTSTPSYPAYPAATPAQPTGPLPVQLAVAAPERQRRLTVLFRILMVIPHDIVLYFLALAAAVVSFLGWWGALFTGRLPDFAASYLTGYIRWSTRVTAYLMLLTDVYPPFSLDDDPAYPVRVAVAPERLNRFAVFFRLILVIPANILGALVLLGGGTIVQFIAWLITLITGKLPASLHLAYAAALRYATRINCYFYLLTPAYPGGLFGDAPAAPASAGVPPTDPAGYPAPGGFTPGYGAAGGFEAAGGFGAAGGYGGPQTSWQPADWRLLLTSGAKRLLVLFITLGVLWFAVWAAVVGIAVASGNNSLTAGLAIGRLNVAYSTLDSNLNSWQSTVTACDKNLTCVTKADGKAAAYFSGFANELRAIPMPSAASAAAGRLYSDAVGAAQDFTELSRATTVAQYQSTYTGTGLQQILDRFDQDYNALGTVLRNS